MAIPLTMIKLAKLCGFISGGTPSKNVEKYYSGTIPWITGADIIDDTIQEPRHHITDEAIENSATNKIPAGNILLVSRTGVGKVAITTEEICISQDFTGLIPDLSKIEIKFLYYFLKSSKRYFLKNQRGATIKGVTRDVVENLDIPVPYSNDPRRSLIEQRRIVARIEALLSEVREMREINQRIIEDTQHLLGAFLNQTFENLPGKENKTINEVGYVKGGKRLPKGESFAAQPTPYPYLRVTDFRNFGIDEADLRYLTPEVHTQIRNYIISDQDVFISIAGTIGLVGTVPAHLSGSNLTENAAKIVFRPEYQDKIKNKYLMYFLASPQGKKQIEARTKAAGQPKLALERIKTITFPYIDSIPQQEAIIEKIEAVQSEVTEMLRTQQADEKIISQVEESILSQAFQGNL